VTGFVTSLIVVSCAYAILATSLDLMMGHSGIFSAGHAALFGVGAYAGSLVALHLTTDVIVALLMSSAIGAVVGVILALPALRAHRVNFIVSSLAFGLIAQQLFNGWTSVTGGASGLTGIPLPAVFGSQISSKNGFVELGIVLVVLALALSTAVVRSPFGRRLHAVRDDQLAAQAMGMRHNLIRLIAVVVACALASWGGVLYAYYIGFVSPDSFTSQQSVLIAAMVVVGGSSTLLGPTVGAVALTMLPQLLQLLSLSPTAIGPVEQIVYGGALIVVMMLRPGGLASLVPAAQIAGLLQRVRFRGGTGGPGGMPADRETTISKDVVLDEVVFQPEVSGDRRRQRRPEQVRRASAAHAAGLRLRRGDIPDKPEALARPAASRLP
jgi:branched-chain amino acid transport system permease protein